MATVMAVQQLFFGLSNHVDGKGVIHTGVEGRQQLRGACHIAWDVT
jgi:hypothetical protein